MVLRFVTRVFGSSIGSLLLLFVFTAPARADVGLPPSQSEYLFDPQNRIHPDFRVPENLSRRVGFWFDIYTRFTATQHVIHHSEYPWIIFDVVDVRPILEGPGHKWTKFHRAIRTVQLKRRQIVADLQRLSHLSHAKKLSPSLLRLRNILSQIPGNPRRVAQFAALNVRSQLGQKDFFASGLINASRYLPVMESTFQAHGLPAELTRLPLVESSFNEDAVSKVGASGIWQLMPTTGRMFLRMTGPLDERNSPLKATVAAARIMKENFKNLRTWPLAITAYNHGPGGLRRASKTLRTTDLATFIAKYKGRDFGFATSNFFCEFLAALHAEKYKREIFGDLPENQPILFSSVALPRSFKLKNLAQLSGLSIYELQTFNPELRSDNIRAHTLLPRGYRVFFPPGHAENIQLIWAAQRQAHRPMKIGLSRIYSAGQPESGGVLVNN